MINMKNKIHPKIPDGKLTCSISYDVGNTLALEPQKLAQIKTPINGENRNISTNKLLQKKKKKLDTTYWQWKAQNVGPFGTCVKWFLTVSM